MVYFGASPRGRAVTCDAVGRRGRVVRWLAFGFAAVVTAGTVRRAVEFAVIHPRPAPGGRGVTAGAIRLSRYVVARLARGLAAVVAG